MTNPSKKIAAAFLATGTLTLAGCGGGSGITASGITASGIGLEIEALADIKLSREVRQIGQGSPPYGATVGRVLIAEDVDGVWVSGARRGSPAAKAGLGPGDLITAVDGEAVTTPGEVDEALDGADAGSPVDVEGLYVASGDATQFLKPWSTEVDLPAG